MNIHCSTCDKVLEPLNIPATVHIIKLKVECDECHVFSKWNPIIERFVNKYTTTVDLYEETFKKSENYNAIEYTQGSIKAIDFLNTITNDKLYTIKYIDLFGMGNVDPFLKALVKNTSLLSLLEINLYGRTFSSDNILDLCENITFKGQIIREEEDFYGVNNVAKIKIIHNIQLNYQNIVSTKTHKIMYTCNGVAENKWKYCDDYAHIYVQLIYLPPYKKID